MQPRGFELPPSLATYSYCWGSGGSAIWPKGFWPERTKNASFIYLSEKKMNFGKSLGKKKMDEAFTTVDLNENRTRINFGKSWLTV